MTTKPIHVLAIAGGSASGKTTLAQCILRRLGPERCSVLSLDDYYFHPSNYDEFLDGFKNWDSPSALNWQRIRSDLLSLAAGHAARPPYDSRMYEEEFGNPTTPGRLILPREVLVVEGMYALLDAECRSACTFTCFLDSPDDIRLSRNRRSIMTLDYVIKVHVPMYNKYVRPTRLVADVVFDTSALTPTAIQQEILTEIGLSDTLR